MSLPFCKICSVANVKYIEVFIFRCIIAKYLIMLSRSPSV